MVVLGGGGGVMSEVPLCKKQERLEPFIVDVGAIADDSTVS